VSQRRRRATSSSIMAMSAIGPPTAGRAQAEKDREDLLIV